MQAFLLTLLHFTSLICIVMSIQSTIMPLVKNMRIIILWCILIFPKHIFHRVNSIAQRESYDHASAKCHCFTLAVEFHSIIPPEMPPSRVFFSVSALCDNEQNWFDLLSRPAAAGPLLTHTCKRIKIAVVHFKEKWFWYGKWHFPLIRSSTKIFLLKFPIFGRDSKKGFSCKVSEILLCKVKIWLKKSHHNFVQKWFLKTDNHFPQVKKFQVIPWSFL